MLAFAPDGIREAVLAAPLTAYTPSTIVDPKRLKTLLRRIRQQGYNVSHGDLDPGAFSVATPVHDHGGRRGLLLRRGPPRCPPEPALGRLLISHPVLAAGAS